MSLEQEKYVRLKIGNAELVPDRHFLNPYAYCSFQAFSELSKFNEELSQARKLIAELVKVHELIAGPVEFYCEIGEANKQAASIKVLSNNRELIEKLTKE